MAPLQAVIFDLWNTLVADPPELTGRREALRLERLGEAVAAHLPLEGSQAQQVVESAYRAMLEEMSVQHRLGRDLSLEERVVLLLSRVSPEASASPALVEDAMEAFVASPQAIPPAVQPGALEAVLALRKAGVRIGLISNTGPSPGRGLRPVLQAHGLLPHFDVLTFSDEVGVCKPAPEIFQRTLAALDVSPSSTAFIGDDPELDVAGPLRVGMWTVQVGERSIQGPADGLRPHARIKSMDELTGALKSLGLLTT